MNTPTLLRAATAAAGAFLIFGVVGAAYADTDSDLDVNVEIAPIVEPGTLALTVASGEVILTEDGRTSQWREFTGELPTVSVTDTRNAQEVPAGAFWYVVGSASDFVGDGDQPNISAGHLGWAPKLVSVSDSGLVAEGDQVDTVMDEGPNAVGLVDQEFLSYAADSAAVVEEGAWSASADLFLRTPLDVAPGSYAATLTLSLFE